MQSHGLDLRGWCPVEQTTCCPCRIWQNYCTLLYASVHSISYFFSYSFYVLKSSVKSVVFLTWLDWVEERSLRVWGSFTSLSLTAGSCYQEHCFQEGYDSQVETSGMRCHPKSLLFSSTHKNLVCRITEKSLKPLRPRAAWSKCSQRRLISLRPISVRDPPDNTQEEQTIRKEEKEQFFFVCPLQQKKTQTQPKKPNHVAAETYSVLVFFRTGLFSHLPPSYGLGTLLGEMLEGKALSEFTGDVVLQLWSDVA